MKKRLLLICLPFVSIMAGAQEDLSAKYAELVNQQGLKEKLTIIAGPEMEGRETASPGERRAAAYIEDQFKKMGLKPGNGDSYQQMFPLYQDVVSNHILRVNGKSFSLDRDFSFGIQAVPATGQWSFNKFVFVGQGNVDSAKNINDYAGLDVKGKIVIMIQPEQPDPSSPNARAAFTALNRRLAVPRDKGALGVVFVSKDFPRNTPTSVKGRMSLTAPTAGAATTGNTYFTATISDEVASGLIGRTSKVAFADWKDVNKGEYTSELTYGGTRVNQTLESSNVIGVLPGGKKKDEFVFITGHYDHLGKVGNVIYYGADDDGSGTVGVMQMAEAFAAAAKQGHKPLRTIIFMTVSGEEKGLLGSQYYSDHPTVDLAKTSVDLNIDMIGRVDTERKTADSLNYVYVIGHDKLSSDLPIINEGANNKYTKLTLDYKFDDPKDVNRIYFRSDHYNFARKGVPILFFYDGMLLADYHRPTDTVDKINFPLMEKRARMIFHTAWEMANRADMLKRDTPLNMGTR